MGLGILKTLPIVQLLQDKVLDSVSFPCYLCEPLIGSVLIGDVSTSDTLDRFFCFIVVRFRNATVTRVRLLAIGLAVPPCRSSLRLRTVATKVTWSLTGETDYVP